ncbi:MAG: APC family permease [Rhizobium sp.]|nr:APC family permease [Rhizobium sp.]
MTTDIDSHAPGGHGLNLHRTITWKHAFWLAAGAPALVLFTLGPVSSTVGPLSPVVWIVSACCALLQAFAYAEISGMFPNKSGGASVFGAVAWVRYGKILGPISVWVNWLAWSPVIAIGVSLAGYYLIDILFAAGAPARQWEITLVNLGFLQEGLRLRIDAVYLAAWLMVLIVFGIQHRGILRAARAQIALAVVALIPLFAIALSPLLTDSFDWSNLFPLLPLLPSSDGQVHYAQWDGLGVSILLAAFFGASYATYPFETAVCYTREFRDPGKDTYRAIMSAGILALLVFSIVPLAFQGVLGVEALLAPGIISGTEIGSAMATMVGGGVITKTIIVGFLIMTLLFSVSTAMAGSSRTLYQGGVDGWLPRYLGRVNNKGAPVAAMMTDLVFNMLLLLLNDIIFLLVVSNVTYLFFVFMNLQSGWLHRIDRPTTPRPYRAPDWLIAVGAMLGFVNMFLLGAGGAFWAPSALAVGVFASLMILPVFWWRHYVQDGGVFPNQMEDDMHLRASGMDQPQTRAGMLPYAALLGGGMMAVAGYWFVASHVS